MNSGAVSASTLAKMVVRRERHEIDLGREVHLARPGEPRCADKRETLVAGD
jgi:hypothetical protein